MKVISLIVFISYFRRMILASWNDIFEANSDWITVGYLSYYYIFAPLSPKRPRVPGVLRTTSLVTAKQSTRRWTLEVVTLEGGRWQ
jgi:hypothetical protein